MTLTELKRRGFDLSTHVRFSKEFHVQCSQCEALCINGVACHETGCPNARRSRRGELTTYQGDDASDR